MVGLVLKIVGIVFVLILALLVFFWVLGVVGFILRLLMGLLLFAGLIFGIYMLFKIGTKSSTPSASYKVSAQKQTAVALFMSEPSVTQLVNIESLSHMTNMALDGTLVEVENDTQVIVLNDVREKQAVHVRVADGKFKGREGWVCRGSLHEEAPKQIKG
jgi:hypothetical protein